eukprot:Hpha_TRINITY_DN30011_c0_g1::TRINITY_DN30011_c0_g1_i1::g.21485::m.21485
MRWSAIFICGLAVAMTAGWLGIGVGHGRLSPVSRTVVVTGGTQGLGRELVEMLAQRGDRVITCGRSEKFVAELNAMANVTAFTCDVSDEASVKDFAGRVTKELAGQRLDALVNNAGILVVGHPLLEAETSAFDTCWDVNTRGTFLVTRALFSLMKPRGGDVPAPIIINLGSSAETPKLAMAFHGMYQMSKTALRAYSNAARQEAAIKGVKLAHVRAGAFDSNLHGSFHQVAKNLKRYGGDHAARADRVQRVMTDNLKMVTSRPARELAELLFEIIHTTSPLGEYDWNLSFIERLVDWIPQRLLDEHQIHLWK